MNRWGRRCLWTCAGIGAVVVVWLGVEYYRWSVVRWDQQDLNG